MYQFYITKIYIKMYIVTVITLGHILMKHIALTKHFLPLPEIQHESGIVFEDEGMFTLLLYTF